MHWPQKKRLITKIDFDFKNAFYPNKKPLRRTHWHKTNEIIKKYHKPCIHRLRTHAAKNHNGSTRSLDPFFHIFQEPNTHG